MARRYVRDKRGRFASKGGGASAGKMGKSEKNTKARAKYKEASGKARAATKFADSITKSKGAGSKDAKFFNRQAGGAKSGLTRVTKSLRGGKSGNLGATTKKASSKKVATKKAAPAKSKTSAATKKKALVKRVSNAALEGKRPTKAQSSYIRAQQGEAMRATSSRGKGSKANRRAKNKAKKK